MHFLALTLFFPLSCTAQETRLATGFNGIAVIPPDTARILGLELWEIPGTIRLEGIAHSGPCRRARMRFREPAVGVDMLLPVAVWEK